MGKNEKSAILPQERPETAKIELRSEEVQEILTKIPHVLIRYGISIIFGVVAVLFLGSFFFKYPDIVPGKVLVTTQNPPVWLAAKVTGKIKELYCHDRQEAVRGQLLAVMDNAANTTDVQLLDKLLAETAVTDSAVSIPAPLLEHVFELGDLQAAYSSFVKAVTDYQNFKSVNLSLQEKASIRREMAGKKVYSSYVDQQLQLKQRELALAKEEYLREKMLYGKGIISASELETAEQAYLSAQQAYSQLQSSATNSHIEFEQLGESVKKLDLQHQQDHNHYFSTLKTAYRELATSLQSWEKNYMLIAPADGTVSFVKFWQANQLVEANGKVFSVVPSRPGSLIAKARVSSASSGKMKAGQLVNIKLDNYPYLEYGMVEGRVAAISMVPDEENQFAVSISLPKGLHTSVGKTLNFTGELSGTAEILTDGRSLGGRLLSPLHSILKEKFK